MPLHSISLCSPKEQWLLTIYLQIYRHVKTRKEYVKTKNECRAPVGPKGLIRYIAKKNIAKYVLSLFDNPI